MNVSPDPRRRPQLSRSLTSQRGAVVALLVVLALHPASAEMVVDFETLGSTLAADSAYVGADLAGEFSENGATFNNNFNPIFSSWNGNAYSNRTTFQSGNFLEFANNNDTAVAPGIGVGGSSTWGVANSFAPNTAVLETHEGAFFDSMYVTNTRTTQFIIEQGNGFSDPFGGVSGNDPDLFTVRFNDLSDNGNGFVEVVLADYRFADNSQDFVLDDWLWVDLSSLESNRIGVEFTSTDVGPFGINTPTYVAFDDIAIAAVPEPSTFAGMALLGGLWCVRRRVRGRSASNDGADGTDSTTGV